MGNTEDWYPPKTEDIRQVYARAENNGDESYLMGWYAEKGFDARLKEEKAEAWDEALAAVASRVGSDGMLDQHRLIRMKNPYRSTE